MLTGKNGILTQAQNAKNRTEKGDDIEKIKLSVSEAQIGDNGYQDLNSNNLQEAVNNQFQGRNVVASDNGDGTFTVSCLDTLKDYIISGNTVEEGINWNEAMKNAVAPESQDEERNGGVIGIGTDGNPVDMDLWEYIQLEDGTYALKTEDSNMSGYVGGFTSNGEIEGHIPQYISIDNGKNYKPVTSLEFCFKKQTNLRIAPKLPNTINNMHETFGSCTNLEQMSNIPNSVNSMISAFFGCSKLVSIPNFPTNLENMAWAFAECSNLKKVPVIPNNVYNMNSTFTKCTSLVEILNLPSNVNDMEGTFYNCSALERCPDIPGSVTNLTRTFCNCTSLVEAPNISNGAETMEQTFFGCENLIKGPDVIPESVKILKQTFQGCQKLSGEMEIDANITDVANCSIPFYDATKGEARLKLKGSCPVLSEIVSDANNPNITL